MLKEIPVSYRTKTYNSVCKLMKEAFPKNEQMPVWILRLLATRKFVRFHAVMDCDTFCGMLYTIENEKYIFILYLAVNENVRSNGYGSKILNLVKCRANGRNVILHAEYPDDNAENAIQRSMRIRFYAQNGIVNTGYYFNDGAVKYMILSTDGKNADMSSYKKLLQELSFGIYTPKIESI